MSLKQAFLLSVDSSKEELMQSSVNGLIFCLSAMLTKNNGIVTANMKESAKIALTAGVILDDEQTNVISKILTRDDIQPILSDLEDRRSQAYGHTHKPSQQNHD